MRVHQLQQLGRKTKRGLDQSLSGQAHAQRQNLVAKKVNNFTQPSSSVKLLDNKLVLSSSFQTYLIHHVAYWVLWDKFDEKENGRSFQQGLSHRKIFFPL